MNSIFTRISVRKYKNKPVEEDKIRMLLKAAMAAPSTANQQPWEFYVVTNKDIIRQLSKSSPYAGCAAGAPVVIVPCYHEECMFADYTQIDLSIATENMWLEASELGLGGVWLGIAPEEDRMTAVREILNLPDGLAAFALFPVGYPAEQRPQQARFDESRIHYVI